METLTLKPETATYSSSHFIDLDEAISHAKAKSVQMNVTMYVIISSDSYWVNSSPEVEEGEKRYGAYVAGVKL